MVNVLAFALLFVLMMWCILERKGEGEKEGEKRQGIRRREKQKKKKTKKGNERKLE